MSKIKEAKKIIERIDSVMHLKDDSMHIIKYFIVIEDSKILHLEAREINPTQPTPTQH